MKTRRELNEPEDPTTAVVQVENLAMSHELGQHGGPGLLNGLRRSAARAAAHVMHYAWRVPARQVAEARGMSKAVSAL